jgi:hypothetical protein
MANNNAPFGFREVQGTGSAPTYEIATEAITSTTAAIFFGDPVARIADGSIAGNTTSALPCCTTAIPLAGIFIGCKYLSVANKKTQWANYWPSSDANSAAPIEGYVVNSPDSRFLAQAGGSTGGGFTQSMIGLLCQFNYNVAGQVSLNSTSTGQSAAYVDLANTATGSATGVSTGSLLPFRFVSLVTPPANFGAYSGTPPTSGLTGAYNTGIVRFNTTEQNATNAYL